MTHTTLALGGRNFTLKPFKLGQLRQLLDALDATGGKTGGALIETAARVVAAGLTPAQPDITHDTVLDLEASLDELNAAMAAILELAGLKPLGEPPGKPLGEPPSPDTAPPPAAVPGMAPEMEASPPFTPPSPPAAATPIATSTA